MHRELSDEDADRLDTLLRAIEELDPEGALPPGETDDTLRQTERKLGRPLHPQLREVWRAIGGGASLVGGELVLFPLVRRPGVKTTGPIVATARNALRTREWFVPEEVVPFAQDGAGDVLGVWSPEGGGTRPLVVLVGAGDGDEDVPSMAVVGEDPLAFLAGWIAHHVWPGDEDLAEEVQDTLGVPVDLQGDPEEIARSVGAHLQATLRWASPTIEQDLTYDPDKGWPQSVSDVRALAEALPDW